MLGLNNADASKEYSLRKYAPISRRWLMLNSACGSKRLFHLSGARLEDVEQVSVTPFEIFEHFAELLRGSLGVEPENSVRQYDWPGLVGTD